MMVTLTIDGRARAFGSTVTVGELYARARLNPAERVLFAEPEGPALNDLDLVLKYPACPYRTFVSEAR